MVLNENKEEIMAVTIILKHGLQANLHTITGKKNEIVYTSDTNQLYVWDDEWINLGISSEKCDLIFNNLKMDDNKFFLGTEKKTFIEKLKLVMVYLFGEKWKIKLNYRKEY